MSTAQINQIIEQLDKLIFLIGLLADRDLAPHYKYGSKSTLATIKTLIDESASKMGYKNEEAAQG